MRRRESAKQLENSEQDGAKKIEHTSMILFFKNGFLIHQVDSMNVSVNIRTSSLPVNSRLAGPCLKGLSCCRWLVG